MVQPYRNFQSVCDMQAACEEASPVAGFKSICDMLAGCSGSVPGFTGVCDMIDEECPAGFSPLLLPSVVEWWDPTDPTTLWQLSNLTTHAVAADAPVGGWESKGPGGHPLIQATLINRHTLKLAEQNGRNILRASAPHSNIFFTAAFARETPHWLWMVVKTTAAGGALTDGINTGFCLASCDGDGVLVEGGGANYAGSRPVGVWGTLAIQYGDPGVVYGDGVAGTPGSTAEGDAGGVVINGGEFGANAADLGDIVIGTGVLSGEDLAALEAWAVEKWGL